MKLWIASCAAPSRVGCTSSACIERDVSTTRITVAFSCRNIRVTCGRASAASKKASASPTSRGGTSRGQDLPETTVARTSTFGKCTA